MPKQLRYSIKQTLTSAYNELVKAGTKMIQIETLYRDDGHPDIADTIKYLSDAVGQVAITVDKILTDI